MQRSKIDMNVYWKLSENFLTFPVFTVSYNCLLYGRTSLSSKNGRLFIQERKKKKKWVIMFSHSRTVHVRHFIRLQIPPEKKYPTENFDFVHFSKKEKESFKCIWLLWWVVFFFFHFEFRQTPSFPPGTFIHYKPRTHV